MQLPDPSGAGSLASAAVAGQDAQEDVEHELRYTLDQTILLQLFLSEKVKRYT